MNIFFSGIGGSGVSAIACFMADRGHKVSGSDRAFDSDASHPLRKLLEKKGIALFPQDGSGISNSLDFAVFSTAVEPDRPEIIRAKELRIPMKTRPEYLIEIVSQYKTIAVSGTSGKSTTSGMLAFLMRRLGLDPNFIGGGRVKGFTTPSNPGNSLSGKSDYLVVEACESDGTIVDYRPLHSIILNLALDHHPVEKTLRMFEELAINTSGKVIVNGDDENLRDVSIKNKIAFSIDSSSEYRATDIVLGPLSSDFSVNGTRFSLPLPGRHNVYNALASIAMLSEIGVQLKDIVPALNEFSGIERRFDIHRSGERLVIDDYAHNPHKIASLMSAVSALRDRVCYIFQPHGYGPTRMMKKEYIEAFAEGLRVSDHLIILPIFYAGGTAAKDISSEDIAEGVRAKGKSAVAVERSEVLKRFGGYDGFVVMGARDDSLATLAGEIANAF